MGLLKTRDGRYKSWLATFLCCCAALNDDEYPEEKKRDDPTRHENTSATHRQPSFQHAPPRYSTQGGFAQLVPADEQDTPPPVYRNSTFELAGVAIPRPAKHRRQLSLTRMTRPSISGPSSFWRLEASEGQRRSLVPLQLGPVVLKEQPDEQPHTPPQELILQAHVFQDPPDPSHNLLKEDSHGSFGKDRRKAEAGRASFSREHNSRRPRPGSAAAPRASSAQEIYTPRLSLSSQSSWSNLYRHSEDTYARPGRATSDPSRLKQRPRKRPDAGVEQEVLELNTIIEGKRAEARRSRAAEDHVPAIAPSMQVRARSETLEGIGSAFSRPWKGRQPLRIDTSLKKSEDSEEHRPWPSRTSSRASQLPSGASCSPTRYTLPPRTASSPATPIADRDLPMHGSRRPSGGPELPALTHASSPTSKSHSRSATAESRYTPLSPLSPVGVYELDAQQEEQGGRDLWPEPAVKAGQVGLAF